ncbi:MAG: lipocalin-like domain-containing protein [Thermoanaerobaculia bacterium]
MRAELPMNRLRRRPSSIARWLSLGGVALLLTGGRAETAEKRFAFDPARPLAFPRDHGAHDDARIEWWYVTGHLRDARGRESGYQLTFFRTGVFDTAPAAGGSPLQARDLYLAHFAITDASGSFRFAERAHRTGIAAGASAGRLDVHNEDWSLQELGGSLVLEARRGWGAELERLSLILTPEKPLVLHGDRGLSRKGTEPDAVSRYVSFTRLKTAGWRTRGDVSEPVEGSSWLDHEWGPGVLGPESAGWDWFALQLEDGRELMLYRIRARSGSASPFSSGTLVRKDGTAVALTSSDFTIEETARWKSPRSGATYPARWVLRVPRESLALEVVPLVADQELVTPGSTHVTYWEGACAVRAVDGDDRAQLGRGYVELTGYAGAGGLGLLTAR